MFVLDRKSFHPKVLQEKLLYLSLRAARCYLIQKLLELPPSNFGRGGGGQSNRSAPEVYGCQWS